MSVLDRAIRAVSPAWALKRARANAALQVVMNYNAATTGNRGASWRRNATDADGAARERARLAYVARDMVRNTPFALRAQTVIANNVIGDGIIWKVAGRNKKRADLFRDKLKAHFDTTSIDADGRCNLYGLQRLAMQAIVDSGEVLIRRRRRRNSDGLPLPFQIQVLEPDHLDTTRDTIMSAADGNEIREGIEYNAIGQRVAYHLFDRHPGSTNNLRGTLSSRRVPASEILHIYRQDRPGQMRGVTWFAPIAMPLQDLDDMQDAQLMRQKIAACFAAFRVTPDGDFAAGAAGDGSATDDVDPGGLSTLVPGRIQNLAQGEDIRFSTPPAAEGYDKFTKLVLQSAAAGIGITYEALSGDLSGVNFSSARMGRMEMDRNVSSWQWLMMIPQMMQPLAGWATEGFALATGQMGGDPLSLSWVPPHRMLIDPAREIPALREKVKAGFASRQGVLRELGHDPEDVMAEQIEDRDFSAANGLRFDSDVHFGTGATAVPVTDPEDDKADPPGQKQTANTQGGDDVQE
ncbi:MAG: phage portal protein [Pseudomonadota bacterium]